MYVYRESATTRSWSEVVNGHVAAAGRRIMSWHRGCYPRPRRPQRPQRPRLHVLLSCEPLSMRLCILYSFKQIVSYHIESGQARKPSRHVRTGDTVASGRSTRDPGKSAPVPSDRHLKHVATQRRKIKATRSVLLVNSSTISDLALASCLDPLSSTSDPILSYPIRTVPRRFVALFLLLFPRPHVRLHHRRAARLRNEPQAP
jgi:hypothetical protein